MTPWPTPAQLRAALDGTRVRYQLVPGWDDRDLSPYDADDVSCDYGILHHTAGTDSLGWMVHNQFDPVRACGFLIDRDGTVHVVTAWPCYHAGAGGPGAWGGGPLVGADVMNQHAYGVEIESKGTSLDTANGNGYTPAQTAAAANLAAAICRMLNWPAQRWINHRTWAPNRKADTLYPDAWWHERIRNAITLQAAPPPLEEPDMPLLITDAGDQRTYLLSGDQASYVTAPADVAALVAVGVRRVTLTHGTVAGILAGKD